MDRVFAPQSPANELDRPVRDDLIDVHIGLRSRTRLPHIEGELTVKLARDHFIGYLADQVCFVPGKFACLSVDDSRRLLHVPMHGRPPWACDYLQWRSG